MRLKNEAISLREELNRVNVSPMVAGEALRSIMQGRVDCLTDLQVDAINALEDLGKQIGRPSPWKTSLQWFDDYFRMP